MPARAQAKVSDATAGEIVIPRPPTPVTTTTPRVTSRRRYSSSSEGLESWSYTPAQRCRICGKGNPITAAASLQTSASDSSDNSRANGSSYSWVSPIVSPPPIRCWHSSCMRRRERAWSCDPRRAAKGLKTGYYRSEFPSATEVVSPRDRGQVSAICRRTRCNLSPGITTPSGAPLTAPTHSTTRSAA